MTLEFSREESNRVAQEFLDDKANLLSGRNGFVRSGLEQGLIFAFRRPHNSTLKNEYRQLCFFQAENNSEVEVNLFGGQHDGSNNTVCEWCIATLDIENPNELLLQLLVEYKYLNLDSYNKPP